MSERVDQFIDNLRDHLNAAEARMDNVKASIGAAKSETRATSKARLPRPKRLPERRRPDWKRRRPK